MACFAPPFFTVSKVLPYNKVCLGFTSSHSAKSHPLSIKSEFLEVPMNRYSGLPNAKLQQQVLQKNPVLVDFMGLCPALAVTNTVYNALGMSLGTSAVLLASSLITASVRRLIPPEVRIPAHIIIIAGLVSAVDVLLKAYASELSKNLGAFVSLIVVNCLILGQIETFSSRNPPLVSLWDAFCTAVGFSLALLLIAVCRELLGSGSITVGGQRLWPQAIDIRMPWPAPWSGGADVPFFRLYRGRMLTPFSPDLGGGALSLFALPAGALFVTGYLGGLFAWLRQRRIKAAQVAQRQQEIAAVLSIRASHKNK